MRKITLIGILIIATFIITSCTKENNTDIRDSLVAIYNVSESWTENGKTVTKADFTITVQKSSINSDKILLNNFANYGAGITVESIMKGNTITIPQQTLSNSSEVSGSGTFTDSTITFTYTEKVNGISYVISAIAKKK